MIGFTAKHLFVAGDAVFHEEAIRSYFLILDSVVTFFYKPFIYLGLVVKLDGEIKKNLYTLFFAQHELIQEENMEALRKEVEVVLDVVGFSLHD